MRGEKYIRVLVIDENPVLVEGLSFLMNSTRHLRGVYTAPNTTNIEQTLTKLRPDVLIVDPNYIASQSSCSISELRARSFDVRILAYTNTEDPVLARDYMERGYCGVVSRATTTQNLLKAISILGYGGVLMDPILAAFPKRSLHLPLAAVEDASENGISLTVREEAVLRRVAMGRATKEIAVDISLSQKTVETYKSRAVRKLSLNSRAEIVQYAMTNGWLKNHI